MPECHIYNNGYTLRQLGDAFSEIAEQNDYSLPLSPSLLKMLEKPSKTFGMKKKERQIAHYASSL